jgi:hypothetical protein
MEGLMGKTEITPTTFQVTSNDIAQAAQWVGSENGMQISKVVQFKNADTFVTTSVTVKNTGTTAVTNFYCKKQQPPCPLISPLL